MLKLSKKTEYALLAIKYIAVKTLEQNNLTQKADCPYISAKEISNSYNIPFELLSKILQKLVKNNIVISFHGIKGGYTLARAADQISLSDVITSIEKIRITNCMIENGSSRECARFDCCQIRHPLTKIQNEIDKLFNSTTIAQIL